MDAARAGSSREAWAARSEDTELSKALSASALAGSSAAREEEVKAARRAAGAVSLQVEAFSGAPLRAASAISVISALRVMLGVRGALEVREMQGAEESTGLG